MAAVKGPIEQRPTMDIPATQLPPGDPRLVEAIVTQLKTKGIFDQFRKECLADVDTKPAFQNLRQRVEGHVNKFLEKIVWKNDINKNQLRDGVRKHVNSLGILDSGIDAIITQVVNPKIKPLILPYVEDTVYAFLQIDKPKRERQGATTIVPEDPVVVPVSSSPETKPGLLPMETDVISSEEDDILARESPESEHKSSPSSHDEFMEPENEDAQDGFESFPPPEEPNTDAVASHVEKLSLTDNTEESKPLPAAKPPLPLFDDQSLDSISSNSSGLTFSTLSGKGSPGSRKSSDKDDSTKQEPRSATSTPLVDEKPMDEEISPPFVASEPSKDYPAIASDAKSAESRSPSLDAVPMAETSLFIPGTEKDDQTVVSGASLISQDDDSQGSRASTSKASLSSFKSEGEEKVRSEKSEGELSTSSSESSDSDKGKPGESPVEGKHYSDSAHKPSKSKSDHTRDKDSKHSKDRDKKHSKSRDDHHSHRDKDRKHHRRDRDHDGDRERSRSHHHQSSSSSGKDGSGSGSGKGSSNKDKEHSTQSPGDKSTEGKSRRDSTVEKENKSSKHTENKVEEGGIENNKQNSAGDKADGKHSSKSDSKPGSSGEKIDVKPKSEKPNSSGDKIDVKPKSEKPNSSGDKSEGKLGSSKSEGKSDRGEKSTSKGDRGSKHSAKSDSKSSSKSDSSKSSKSIAERSEKKHSAHSSKHSSKHKKQDNDSFYSDKLKSINIFKDEKKKKEEKDARKEKGSENKHSKEEKEIKKHSKEGKDQKKDPKTREESHHKEEKDRDEKPRRIEKDIKLKPRDVTAVQKESDKSNIDKKLKTMKSKENNDRGSSGQENLNKKLRVHKPSSAKKPSSPKDSDIKENELLLFNDEKSIMLISYEDNDEDGDDAAPAKTKRLKRDLKKGPKSVNNTKEADESLPDKPVKQNEAIDPVSDFEGFSNAEKDTRLSDFLATAQRVPDDMDIEYSDWFDESDLHMVVREDDIKERMDFSEFLSCMNKLGAIVQESSVETDTQESDSKDDDLSKTRDVPERRTRAQLQGKRRRISTSSSASSSASLSGSPKHKRTRTACMTSADAGMLVEQDPVIVSGFALLTPEDDGNRTSSRDYVDYNQRINSYSPLSPASDSSADDGKGKLADVGSLSGRAPPTEVSSQRVKDGDIFKSAKTWTSEETNLSV
ncbi:biorientation of chromosomes in cell division protein 1-like 1 isoform X2 [Eriocheir sinensis]|uniref:biorientation of chromosomes in cell division protein 1-like 1 isoform X2 n=1 Tax=Eriocheir sinensis TaxID=95602 RepID=UPI0021C61C61|nr:biorientation of chromosomes in cell division protein 1-like 1 isoform X2 [Eriocheir sinensis]